MNCRACSYPLWNIAARTCPECGGPFKPSDFSFMLNSVQFCCPHCSQAYYGTGAGGHLVPAAFNCTRCQAPITMDEMVLLPAQGVEERQTVVVRDLMPWVNRSRIGRFKAFMGTIGAVAGRPTQFIQSTPVDSSDREPLLFAWFTLSFAILLGAGFYLILIPTPWKGALGAAVIVLMPPILMLLWAMITHLTLSALAKPAHDFSRTLQCICYSSATMFFAAVPCLGPQFMSVIWIWWLIAATLMLHAGQRVSTLAAAVAVTWFPILTIALSAFGAYWFIAVRTPTPPPPAPPPPPPGFVLPTPPPMPIDPPADPATDKPAEPQPPDTSPDPSNDVDTPDPTPEP